MLKVELHSHSNDDPSDLIPHTTSQLIQRAAALGYQALAITLHDRQLDLAAYRHEARAAGITLIPGIERTIEGKHVLLINFRRGVEDVRSFDDLARLKSREPGLVVAPHPFFPAASCLQRRLDEHAELFDAVEYNGMFTRSVNFNREAVRWAGQRGKTIVGNGDVHRLAQLDTTYSMIDAEPDADAICDAIRAGKVRLEARPHSAWTAAVILADMFASDLRRDLLHETPGPAPTLT